MADGATPSNEGPGYVLRRLIRRAHRFGRTCGATMPFLHRALPVVTEVCGETYPELLPKRDFSAKVVHGEEERFGRAFGRGFQEFDELRQSLAAQGQTVIPGGEAFRLLATYGLPMEFTKEMAEDAGMTVDREGFIAALAAHARRSSGKKKGLEIHAVPTELPPTEFVGYGATQAEATIIAVLDRPAGSALAPDELEIALDRSPFYAERGGQVGDTGTLELGLMRLQVLGVSPGPGDVARHRVRVVEGGLLVGQTVTARVDAPRRRDIMRHHTATHLLQAALRKTLGEHVTQQGSLVAPDRLRFDFTHHEAVSPEELAIVEDLVNEWILADIPVEADTKPREVAVAEGAIALFGEKYEDTVRVVRIEGVSMELCGGTHSPSTGFIGSMRIVSEGSAAANVRRIEAVTGLWAVRRARERDALLVQAAHTVGCRPEELPDRVTSLRMQLSEARKAAAQAVTRTATDVQSLLAGAASVNAARLVVHRMDGAPDEALKTLADELVARGDKVVAVIASVGDNGKIRIVSKVDGALVAQGAHAGKLVGEVAKLCGGAGGGKAAFAEAGGRDPEKLDAALEAAVGILAKQLGQ